jgi:hypothetical protein
MLYYSHASNIISLVSPECGMTEMNELRGDELHWIENVPVSIGIPSCRMDVIDAQSISGGGAYTPACVTPGGADRTWQGLSGVAAPASCATPNPPPSHPVVKAKPIRSIPTRDMCSPHSTARDAHARYARRPARAFRVARARLGRLMTGRSSWYGSTRRQSMQRTHR